MIRETFDSINLPYNFYFNSEQESKKPLLIDFISIEDPNFFYHREYNGKSPFDDVYWQRENLTSLVMNWIPFLSNCKGYDKHVILYDLIENSQNCFFPEQSNVNIIKPIPIEGFTSVSDSCDLKLNCRYDEIILKIKGKMKNWFSINRETVLFYFTKDPMPNEYITNLNNTEYNELINNYDPRFIEVKFIPVDFVEYCLPTVLDIYIEYFQKERNLKNLVYFNVYLSNYTDCPPLNEAIMKHHRDYTANIKFNSLGYVDLLNKFKFDIPIYIFVYIFLGSVILLLIIVVWGINYYLADSLKSPPLNFIKFFKFGIWPAIKGYFFSLGVIGSICLTLFLTRKNDFFLNITLNWNDFNNISDINIAKEEQIKRSGLFFFIASSIIFYLVTDYLIPIPKNETISEEHAAALEEALSKNKQEDEKNKKSQFDFSKKNSRKKDRKKKIDIKDHSTNKDIINTKLNNSVISKNKSKLNESVISKNSENNKKEDEFEDSFDTEVKRILETINSLSWKRRDLIFKYMAFSLFLVLKTEFSLSGLFNEYIYLMSIIIFGLDFFLEETVLNVITKDAYLAAPLICMIKISTSISFIAVDEFKYFIICFLIKLIIRIPHVIYFIPIVDYTYEIINHKIFVIFVSCLKRINKYNSIIELEYNKEMEFEKDKKEEQQENYENKSERNYYDDYMEKIKDIKTNNSSILKYNKLILMKYRIYRFSWTILKFLMKFYFEKINKNHEKYTVFVNLYLKSKTNQNFKGNSSITKNYSSQMNITKEKFESIAISFLDLNQNSAFIENESFKIPKPPIYKNRENTIDSIHRCLLTFTTDLSVALLTPIYLLMMLLFEYEIKLTHVYNITISHFIYYCLFALIFSFLEIFFLIFMYNTIEIIFGFRLQEYLVFCYYRFSIRNSSWINMRENLDMSLTTVWRSIDAMLYSNQYYFIVMITTTAGILLIFSIGMMIRHIYNPLGDPIFIIAILLFIAYYLTIDFILQRFKYIFKIWTIEKNKSIFNAEEGKFLEFLEIKPSLKNIKKFMKTELFRHKFITYNKNFILNNLDKLLIDENDLVQDLNISKEGSGLFDKVSDNNTFFNKVQLEKIKNDFKDIYQNVVNYDAIDRYLQAKKNHIKKEMQILPYNQKIKGDVDEVYNIRMDISDDNSADEQIFKMNIPIELKGISELKRRIAAKNKMIENYSKSIIKLDSEIDLLKNNVFNKTYKNSIISKDLYCASKKNISISCKSISSSKNNKYSGLKTSEKNTNQLDELIELKRINEDNFNKQLNRDLIFINKKSNQFILKFCLLSKIWLGKAKEVNLFKKWSLEFLEKILKKTCEICKSRFNLHIVQEKPFNNLIMMYKNKRIGEDFSKISWNIFFEKNQKFKTLCMECSYSENVKKKKREIEESKNKKNVAKLNIIDRDLRKKLNKPHVKGIILNWLFEARSNILLQKLKNLNN